MFSLCTQSIKDTTRFFGLSENRISNNHLFALSKLQQKHHLNGQNIDSSLDILLNKCKLKTERQNLARMTRLELESFGFLSRWFLRLPDNDLTRYHTFWIVFRSLLFIFIFAFVLAFVVVFAIQTRVAKTVGEACCCCAMWFPRVIIEIGYSSVVVFTFYD